MPLASLPTSIRWFYNFGIVKADDAADESAPWIIYIKASTPDIDFDNERVLQQALRNAANYFKENGKITLEHVDHEHRHDASIIIGEPMDVQFPPDGSTMIQARLYPHQPQAQFVWNILRSGGKLKASIGGSCAKRPGRDGVTEIPQLFWSHVAVTSWPVNDQTLVSLQPFSAFVKALGTFEASPLVPEDLEGTAYQVSEECQRQADRIRAYCPTLTEDEARQVSSLLLTHRTNIRREGATS